MPAESSEQGLSYLAKYTGVTPDIIEQVEEHTRLGHLHLASSVMHMLGLANHLLAVRNLLPVQAYKVWVRTEFDLGVRTAQRYVRVAHQFAEHNLLEFFLLKGLPQGTSKDALFSVTAPSVGPAITTEALASLIREEPLTRALAKQLITASSDFLETAREAEVYGEGVQQLVLSHGIRDVDALPALEVVAINAPEVLAELMATGSVEIVDEDFQQRPLNQMRASDIESLFKAGTKEGKQSDFIEEMKDHSLARISVFYGDGAVNVEYFKAPRVLDFAEGWFEEIEIKDFLAGDKPSLISQDINQLVVLTRRNLISTTYM